MKEKVLTFVKIPNVLIVGMVNPDEPTIVYQPRMVFVKHEANEVTLAKFMGSPNVIEVKGEIDFSYVNQDADMTKFYDLEVKEQVPGLKLV